MNTIINNYYPVRMRCIDNVHTKIARSRLLGIVASSQCCFKCHNGKKVMSLCSKLLYKDHECYKLCFLVGHAYHMVFQLRMLEFEIGKGRQFITVECRVCALEL